jgi:hypothetical protein
MFKILVAFIGIIIGNYCFALPPVDLTPPVLNDVVRVTTENQNSCFNTYPSAYSDFTKPPNKNIGDVCYMRLDDAEAYCQAHDERLPTARELAHLAVTLGAKGIKEISAFANIEAASKAGYQLVVAKDISGKADQFYYNNSGSTYQGPGLWSSSRGPQRYHPELRGDFSLDWDGDIQARDNLYVINVKCVSNKVEEQTKYEKPCVRGQTCPELSLLPALAEFDDTELHLTFNKAQAYCSKNGGRLPTIRELVNHEAISCGSKTVEISEPRPTYGTFDRVVGVNPNGKIDQFYYSSRNYNCDGNSYYWSSTTFGSGVLGLKGNGMIDNFDKGAGYLHVLCAYPKTK